jgi:hypothetical protein
MIVMPLLLLSRLIISHLHLIRMRRMNGAIVVIVVVVVNLHKKSRTGEEECVTPCFRREESANSGSGSASLTGRSGTGLLLLATAGGGLLVSIFVWRMMMAMMGLLMV